MTGFGWILLYQPCAVARQRTTCGISAVADALIHVNWSQLLDIPSTNNSITERW